VNKPKVLLIRLDKIGDLICTLPVDQVLDPEQYDVTWAVQKGLGSVVNLGDKSRKFLELDKADAKISAARLRDFLKSENFDYAVSFQCPWWVNFELFKAGIKHRAGVKSQWHSFLFLNEAVRQRRSLAEKHEFDYNLEIVLKTFGLKQTKEFIQFRIDKPKQKDLLFKYNLSENDYVVVHPGMSGSALNWPQSSYIDYIQKLLDQNKKVVITGTDSDEPYLTEIKKKYADHAQVLWLQSKLNLNELVQLLAYADYVVVPSTGVAHIAASVGAKVKAIFSPVRVHHPKRWAPRGSDVEIWMINVS
jgi:ADP-heptose:LPS heptosyltransferase